MSIYGLDLLGLAKTNIQMLIKNIKHGTAIGCLMGTFGDPFPNLRKLANTGKVPAVRIHLTNGPCERNHNCEENEVKSNEFDRIQKRLNKCISFANDYPNILVYVSPRLEHDVRDKNIVNKWIEMIKASGKCIPVICPASGYVPRETIIERHGNKVRGGITSNDGESLTDAPQSYFNSGKVITFAWLPTFNGRGSGDKVFISPSKRPLNAFPDVHDINYCNLWFENIGINSDIKPPDIYKPYCEFYSTHEDKRERKPVFLSKIKVPYWDVLTKDGTRKISKFTYYPGDFGELRRYYSNDYCDDLYKKLGNNCVAKLKYQNKEILINVIYRQGVIK